MDNANTPEPTRNPLDDLTELALAASEHPAVAPPLRELVPALVAIVREQAEFIATFKS